MAQCSAGADMGSHQSITGQQYDSNDSSMTKLDYTTPGVLLAGAPLDLEQRGVLVLVPLAALVAGEHRLRVQTSRHHRDGFSEKMQI